MKLLFTRRDWRHCKGEKSLFQPAEGQKAGFLPVGQR